MFVPPLWGASQEKTHVVRRCRCHAPVAGAAPKKSKKLLFIIIGVVVLALLGAGGAFFILKKNTAEAEGDGEDTVLRPRATMSTPTNRPSSCRWTAWW
ncbi:MAG: hypothetical protein R3E56_01410 [Burkholderiaceae bacterium]